jgi:hypothetical protein
MSDYRLGMTALGRRCTISKRSKKDPRLAVGNVQDAHNDFLHCVLEWLEHGKVRQVVTVGGESYTISCNKDVNQ